MENPLRKSLLERRVTIGSWIQMNDPAAAEVLANAGYEWIGIDMEHTDIDFNAAANLMRAMYGRGPVPTVRVSSNETMAIRRALDTGAQAVFVPLINTPEDARKAVASAKYPPAGIRGFAFCRANNWGVDFDAYAAAANDNTAVVAMIESAEAVENIDAILAVNGIDGIFVGPYDMSGSYGMAGKTQDPVVRNACRKVVAACEKAGKSAGLHVVKPTRENVENAVEDGFTLLCLGGDDIFMDAAARDARTLALSVLEKKP